MRDELMKYWRANFPQCPPISYLFKTKLSHLWFRTHSLPESKRYAENAEERQEILRRQQIIFNDVIGRNEECFLVCLDYNKQTYKRLLPRFLAHESEPVRDRETEKNEEDQMSFQPVFGKQRVKFDELARILTAVAEWKIAYFFILNPNSKRIFAPYDGGVDLILENSAKRDEFKCRYKDWLSSHPKGY